jgi:hypothetical protein
MTEKGQHGLYHNALSRHLIALPWRHECSVLKCIEEEKRYSPTWASSFAWTTQTTFVLESSLLVIPRVQIPGSGLFEIRAFGLETRERYKIETYNLHLFGKS